MAENFFTDSLALQAATLACLEATSIKVPLPDSVLLDFLKGKSNSGNIPSAIEKQVQLLQTAIRQSHGTIIITNQLGEIEYANPAFSRITGYKLKEAIAEAEKRWRV